MNFSDSASFNGEKLMFFHDNMMLVIVSMSMLVFMLLVLVVNNKNYSKFLSHNSIMEIMWTSVPAVMLLFIAYPSLYLLYNMDEILHMNSTIKCLGHQWYWKYEELDDVDSYMMNTKDMTFGNHSLLNVDNIISSKLNYPTSLMVSGNDVMHSFTIPQLGLKVDGMPGKLNQTFFNMLSPGTYYGQCSEMCGAEHSFMPIKLTTI